MTSRKTKFQGNIVNWETARWNVTNMEKNEVEDSKLCKAQQLGPVIFSERLSAFDLQNLCNKVNGGIFVIKSEEDKNITLPMKDSRYQKCIKGNTYLDVNLIHYYSLYYCVLFRIGAIFGYLGRLDRRAF